MRARRVGLQAVFLALLAVFLARPAWSQTTTSTLATTTTTTVTTTTATTAAPTTTTATTTTMAPTTTTLTPGAGIATCVVENDSLYVNGPYHVIGHCRLSPSYVDGGDGFGPGNTLAEVGQALCNSFARVPIVVLVEAAHPVTTNWLLFDYDHDTRKLRVFDPRAGTEVVAGTDLSAYTVRFRADCR